MDKTEKWQFSDRQRCDFCRGYIYEEDVVEESVVTKCPYCDRSFLE